MKQIILSRPGAVQRAVDPPAPGEISPGAPPPSPSPAIILNPLRLPAPAASSLLTGPTGSPARAAFSSPFPFYELLGADAPDRARRYAWSELMKRSFRRDVLVCTECGGPMRLVAFISDPEVVGKILGHLGLASRGPPPRPPPARKAERSPGSPGSLLPLDSLDGVDPVFADT